jgi:hypothetical protein
MSGETETDAMLALIAGEQSDHPSIGGLRLADRAEVTLNT